QNSVNRAGTAGHRTPQRLAIWLLGVGVVTAGAFLTMAGAQAPAPLLAPPADLVLRGGAVITLDATDRVARAIAVRGNRIRSVGSDAEIQRLAGPSTRVIDLKGRGVVPGFIDSHTHVESTAEFHRFWIDLHSPPMPPERSSAAIMKALGARVAQVPPGTWVV